MSDRVFVGIDPGQSGALVALSSSGALIAAHRTPLFRNVFDVHRATEILAALPRPVYIACEAAIPTGRSKSVYADSGFMAIKRSIAMWRASTNEVVVTVPPRRWQSLVLKDIPGETTKQQSIEWCRRSLPELDLFPGKCRTPHDGLADAACIAEYARMFDGHVPARGRARKS